MSARPDSRLAPDPLAPLRFERRCAPREPASGDATAHRIGGPSFGRLHRLALCDISSAGLRATCDSPIEPGVMVSVGFADGWQPACRGTVRRCVPCGHGYEVAIEFLLRRAA